MTALTEKLALLWPEIALLVGACVCLVTGLSGSKALRKATPGVAMLSLVVAAVLLRSVPNPVASMPAGVDARHFMQLGGLAAFAKLAVIAIGLILVMVATGTPDALRQIIAADSAEGKAFEPGDCFRGEFYAFMLFSLTGVMLCAGASDLVWLFLALELTSLPTYVMAATSRDKPHAQEAAVKYFFLGAMSAAVFLFGFALIYGATGFTEFGPIASYVQAVGVSPLMMTGVVLAVVGISFKIAAVPMHYYTADVYEGAATPVTAFLAFVPKTAGFVSLIGILGLVGWGHSNGGAATELPAVLVYLLALIAVLTMTVGNVLGLMQKRIKRVLAYSSIAHSGYMLVGLLVGPAAAQAVSGSERTLLSNGLAAVLFYLVAYGLSTVSSFAVIACMSRPDGSEVETYDDLAGMRLRHPFLAAVLLVSVISLVGLPPLVGFLGKLYLIGSAYSAASVGSSTAWVYPTIVVIMVLNSAISAGYYLRIASVAFFGEDRKQTVQLKLPVRTWGATIAAAAALLLGGLPGDLLVESSRHAAERKGTVASPTRPATDDPGKVKPSRESERAVGLAE
ncbi:MAG: NADH-quinone oxidoreductase subunit N [Phycisphaerales bacterium JB063]